MYACVGDCNFVNSGIDWTLPSPFSIPCWFLHSTFYHSSHWILSFAKIRLWKECSMLLCWNGLPQASNSLCMCVNWRGVPLNSLRTMVSEYFDFSFLSAHQRIHLKYTCILNIESCLSWFRCWDILQK